jgi:hypothetical protein
LGITGTRAVMWRPGDDDEVVVEEEFGDGSTQARRVGVGAVRTDRDDLLL